MELKSQAVFVGLPMSGTKFKIVDFETREIVILSNLSRNFFELPLVK